MPSYMGICRLCLLLVVAYGMRPCASAATGENIPRTTMPARVSGLLQEALQSAPTPVPTRAGWAQYARTCQERLSQLAKIPWVDLSQCQRDADELVWLNSFAVEYGEHRVATNAGLILAEDRRGSLWFHQVDADVDRLVREGSDGRAATLTLGRMISNLAEAHDDRTMAKLSAQPARCGERALPGGSWRAFTSSELVPTSP